MHLYPIPALYCPFPGAINPMYEAIEEHTYQWILDFQLTPNYEVFSRYRAYRYPLFIARSFPKGDYTEVCNWCDFYMLLFIVEDIFGEADIIERKETYAAFEVEFMEILEHNKRCRIRKDGPLLAALSDFWRRMSVCTSKSWQSKFVSGIKLMFRSLAWQFRHLISGVRPDPDEYMHMRQYLGATHLSTDCLEVTGKIFLGENIYAHPFVKKLTSISRNILCVANDLFSLSKDLSRIDRIGEYNMVTVLRYKYHISIEEAIYKTAAIHDDLVNEFIDLAQRIFIFDDHTNHMLRKYIEALGYQMRGNMDWSTRETTRYPHINMN
jgi:hypothetical protein